MGNCKKRPRTLLSAYSTIGIPIQCPKCGYKFPPATSYEAFNFHLDLCLMNHNFSGAQSNSLENSIKKSNELQFWKKNSGVWELEKAEISSERLNFLKNATPQQINTQEFPQKLLWFRFQLEKLRIPWTSGSDGILIRKDKILEDSLNFINTCNMHKEIKVFFEADNVQDAGGLLREWIHLIVKELGRKEAGVLLRTATEEILYKLNDEMSMNIENMQKFKLLGKILGKAVFDRIPINLALCRSLIKSILDRQIELDDIKYFDSKLFESWTFLKNIDLASEVLEQDFTYYDSKTGENKELKPGGKSISIDQSNKAEYIELSVKQLVEKGPYMNKMLFLEEFHKIVPLKYLAIFEAEEFEMIINGVPQISVEEWQENTVYKGEFNNNHMVIKWFWNNLKKYSQEELSKILQFCTGSTRISLEGFRGLESNRGTLTKFCIESAPFRKENPFLKAHTCFNRLEIPLYQTYDELKLYMNCIITNNFEGVFGLE